MDEMNIPLQQWISNNIPKEEMRWKDSWTNQVCFVRDEISSLLINEYNYELFKEISENIKVISTHRSKSIILPVYKIEAFGNTYILRNNFHDWKISVDSKIPHDINFEELGIIYNSKEQINHIYCEGFKEEWVYKPHDENKNKYTVEICDSFRLKLFFWLITKKDIIWGKK